MERDLARSSPRVARPREGLNFVLCSLFLCLLLGDGVFSTAANDPSPAESCEWTQHNDKYLGGEASRYGKPMRFDVPPPAAETRFDTRRRNLAWGEKQPSKRHIEQYSRTASISLFDAGHRTFRCGVELFDVTSNFSTSHRTFRRDVEMFDVGHRKVGGERLPPDPSLFPHFHV